MPPIYSTITLFAEIIISAIVYFTIYKGYKHNKFNTKLALGAVLYEILFNISYMLSRFPKHIKTSKIEPAFVIFLAIIHGLFSLIMFFSLIIFFIIAWRKYLKQENYFKKHKILTAGFLFFWTFSVLSGILFYILEYLI